MKKLFFILFLINFDTFSQDKSLKKNIEISGKAHLTNNGISLIPTFSLEKPATIFDFSFSSNKISFDPELSFSLEGKPWFFLFWWRYKIINNKKFNLKLGINPSLDFKEKTLYSANGIKKKIISSLKQKLNVIFCIGETSKDKSQMTKSNYNFIIYLI